MLILLFSEQNVDWGHEEVWKPWNCMFIKGWEPCHNTDTNLTKSIKYHQHHGYPTAKTGLFGWRALTFTQKTENGHTNTKRFNLLHVTGKGSCLVAQAYISLKNKSTTNNTNKMCILRCAVFSVYFMCAVS